MTQLLKSLNASFNEVKTASTASGGTALSTTATLISLPLGTEWVSLTPRNFATAVVAKVAINPWLSIVYTTDDLVSEGTDISKEAQDGDGTDITIPAFTTGSGDYIYVGAELPFRGVAVDLGTAVNNNNQALTCEYWNGSAWVALSETDGTDSTGTFAVDGNVTWTVPSVWAKSTLRNNAAVTAEAGTFNSFSNKSAYIANLYWTRWSVDGLIDTFAIDQMRALNRSTSYLELTSGQAFEFTTVAPVGEVSSIGCIEALTDAGTANLIVSVAANNKSNGFV